MPKTATDRAATRLSGPTMGTHWQVTLDDPQADVNALTAALQAAVDAVDRQMSTWRPDSALMRFNAATLTDWHPLPDQILAVLEAGLAISAATDGAFEMNCGAAVRAWGFGPVPPDLAAIRAAGAAPRIRALDALELDRAAGLARKTAPLTLDLCGIAKGYGVDRLAETLRDRGIRHALCAIDGELRALGPRGTGEPWAVGLDDPDNPGRGDHSVIALDGAALATSGDYRHFWTVRGKRLSHTIDPARHAPLVDAPASVSVLAPTCMMADALATALMVMGREEGTAFARRQGAAALFLGRGGRVWGTGALDPAAA